MSGDNDELNERLTSASGESYRAWNLANAQAPTPVREQPTESLQRTLVQWGTDDDKHFVPSTRTKARLPPGLYDIQIGPSVGMYFRRIPVRTEGLLRFPHSNCDKVVAEIAAFWERRPRFEEFGLTHKRGIMLWGPPGSGKSCTIALAMHDVIARSGVAVRFGDPGLFMLGMRALRDIQPETPVVVLMEDMDSIIRHSDESTILNILDGVELVDRTVFLASTNYPEMLGPRIMNRPSRFDKRYKVGHPTPVSRRMYFEHLLREREPVPLGVDLDRWVQDTHELSLAHLKELFIAVVILGDDYEEAIATLQSMRERASSESEGLRAGFARSELP